MSLLIRTIREFRGPSQEVTIKTVSRQKSRTAAVDITATRRLKPGLIIKPSNQGLWSMYCVNKPHVCSCR
jgi:hypothetical protein